jgi:hypothetical protein
LTDRCWSKAQFIVHHRSPECAPDGFCCWWPLEYFGTLKEAIRTARDFAKFSWDDVFKGGAMRELLRYLGYSATDCSDAVADGLFNARHWPAYWQCLFHLYLASDLHVGATVFDLLTDITKL